MQITQISQDFSVSPQITTADVTEIANAGFKSIICNRPNCRNPFLPIVAAEIAPQSCFTPQTASASE